MAVLPGSSSAGLRTHHDLRGTAGLVGPGMGWDAHATLFSGDIQDPMLVKFGTASFEVEASSR